MTLHTYQFEGAAQTTPNPPAPPAPDTIFKVTVADEQAGWLRITMTDPAGIVRRARVKLAAGGVFGATLREDGSMLLGQMKEDQVAREQG